MSMAKQWLLKLALASCVVSPLAIANDRDTFIGMCGLREDFEDTCNCIADKLSDEVLTWVTHHGLDKSSWAETREELDYDHKEPFDNALAACKDN